MKLFYFWQKPKKEAKKLRCKSSFTFLQCFRWKDGRLFIELFLLCEGMAPQVTEPQRQSMELQQHLMEPQVMATEDRISGGFGWVELGWVELGWG